MNNNSSNINFGAATHVYFYTTKGDKILSPDNMHKCERYLIRQLNNAKNLKERNMDLVDTFKAGDRDFRSVQKSRSFYEKSKAFVSVITGEDVNIVNNFGKEIGKAKKMSKDSTGSTRSFETSLATDLYNRRTRSLVANHGIYKDSERQAFKIYFEPQLKKDGTLKGFKYIRSGWFNESNVKQ